MENPSAGAPEDGFALTETGSDPAGIYRISLKDFMILRNLRSTSL